MCVVSPRGTKPFLGSAHNPGLQYSEDMRTPLQAHLASLKKKNVSNGAIVVVDNLKHELVALVGSKDFYDSTTSGQVNGALALRQPGSTLKPFTYGIALESGMTAAELLADIPREEGDEPIDFLPENYDKKFHGPVLLRNALACSYNVPAVRTAERFGEGLLLQKLHLAGFASLNRPASYYGVGLTLGNGEVTLLELANGYSTLANKGESSALHFIDSVKEVQGLTVRGWKPVADTQCTLGDSSSTPNSEPTGTPVFSEQIAFILTDILSDAAARSPAFGPNSSLSLPFRVLRKPVRQKITKTIGL